MNNTFKFNHEASTFYDGIGASDKLIQKCKEVIYFSTISNYLIKSNFYENDGNTEVPSNLKTVTGDLEKALELVSSEKEKEVLLLMFKEFQEFVVISVKKYEMFNELPDKDKKKAKAIFNVLDLIVQEKEEEENKTISSMKEIFEKVQMVEQSQYNFEKYLKIVEQNEHN